MKEIVIASSNKGKIAELKAGFSHLPVTLLDLSRFKDFEAPEETGATFADNAVLKAKFYASKTGMLCLADDSGLEVDALDGAPGVFSARYAGIDATPAACNEKLLSELMNVEDEHRTARFRCVLALAEHNQTILLANGVCEGTILRAARGDKGFGYDPLFFVPKLGKTMAEISLEEKNRLSHRGQAIKLMAAKLAQFLGEQP